VAGLWRKRFADPTCLILTRVLTVLVIIVVVVAVIIIIIIITIGSTALGGPWPPQPG
jgi:hypothetical protein